MNMEHWCSDMDEGKTVVFREKARSSATLTTKNPTGNGMGLNPGLRGEICAYSSLFQTT